MCGRFSLIHSPDDVAQIFNLDAVEDFPPRYNIAPTQPVLVVGAAPTAPEGSNRPDKQAQLMRWGLLPSWVKDPKAFPTLINARSETAIGKPSFRAAMRHRRCLLPASGFYEWQRDTATKQSQAWWVPTADGTLAAFAGVHETWIGVDGSEIDTVAILTTEATGRFSAIHNRIPVVISPSDFSRWMDCKTQEPREIVDLMVEPPEGFFEPIAISDKVNKVGNNSAEILQPVAPKDFNEPKNSKKDMSIDDQPSLF